MNIYSTSFISACPNDGELITYELHIETDGMIMCEAIKAILAGYASKAAYQEAIADALFTEIPCKMLILEGTHVGVEVVCHRP